MSRDMTLEEVLDDVRLGLGPDLCKLLDEEGWSDIMVNPDGSVWIDREEMTQVKCNINQNGLNSAALTLASFSNQSYNKKTSQSLIAIIPIMNLRTIFWNRPAVGSVAVDFRKPSKKLLEPEVLVQKGTLTKTQLDFIKEAIAHHKNIVISGGTGSGKTTIMNSMLSLVDDSERLITIEDTPELLIKQPNCVPLIVNEEYPYSKAIADALRGRPTRIIIGECRKGDQTLQMLKAWNTGHPGGMTTIHANSTADVITRMDQLCSEVSVSSQVEMIKGAVDVIMQMQRLGGSVRKVVDLWDQRNGEEGRHVE